MSRRQRGVVLTDRGKERLEAAIASAQDQEKYGARFTQAELEDRIGCNRKTIKKIRERLGPSDETFVRSLFKAFGLQLEAPDYGHIESDSFATSQLQDKQYDLNQDFIPRTSGFQTPSKKAQEFQFIGTLDLESISYLPEQRIKEIKKTCCSKILRLYSETQLLNRYRAKIDQIYVDTFILGSLTSDCFATIPDLLKLRDPRNSFDRLGIGSRKERLSGLDVAKKYLRLMVLGKPGAGKSTFLRFLAVLCSRGEIFEDKIPLLIELKHLEDDGNINIKDAIHKELALKDKEETEFILKQGRLLVLLDGLDEVSAKSRRKIQKGVEAFVQDYHANRLVVTCRTQTTEYILDKFTYIEIANLSSKQIERFSSNWFASQFGNDGDTIHKSFMENLYLSQNQQTAELATTPILLSLICWIYSDSKSFPEKKYKLYENGLNLLLGTWDERRGLDRESKSQFYRSLSKTEKKKLLSLIALNKFQEKQRLLFDADEICIKISQFLDVDIEDACEILSDIESQHGIIIERAQRIYSFSHLTFQEFFVAKSIADDFDSGSQKIVHQYFDDRDWREVFLLLFSMLNEPDELIISLKEKIDNKILSDLRSKDLLAYLCREKSQQQKTRRGGIIRLSYLNLVFETILDFQSIYDACFLLSQSLYEDQDKAFSLDYGLIVSLDRVFEKIRRSIHENADLEMGKAFNASLDNLKTLLPHPGTGFLRWWRHHGHDWSQDLKKILDEHMGISSYWQLDHSQKESISTYLYSSNLLLSCTEASDSVSSEVQSFVEDKLLIF